MRGKLYTEFSKAVGQLLRGAGERSQIDQKRDVQQEEYYEENCGYSDRGKVPCGEYIECLWCPNHPDKRKQNRDTEVTE